MGSYIGDFNSPLYASLIDEAPFNSEKIEAGEELDLCYSRIFFNLTYQTTK